VNKSQKNK